MRLLSCLLLFCYPASGQFTFYAKDSSIVKEIDLPAKEPFDTSKAYYRETTPYIYISSDNDLYNYFGWQTASKYHEFDFKNYHIFGEQACRQCMEFCHHDAGQTACHRNKCDMEWIWVMRDNKKAFTEIPVSILPGHISKDLPPNVRSFWGDTLIKSKTDTAIAKWYTTGRGDCFARFEYRLYADKYHSALLLKEWNYWGGCRAGGRKDFTLSFSMPEGILYKFKNTILVD